MVELSSLTAYYLALSAAAPAKQAPSNENKAQQPAQPKPQEKKPEPEKKPASKEDDIDLFGEDENDAEYEAALQARIKAADEAKAAAGKKKAAVISKSAVILDVKTWDDSIDLKELEAKIRQITKDGLEWKAAEIVPVAFTVKKIRIMCHIEDEKVSMDDIQEEIQSWEDEVQSTDIHAFNKL